MRAGLRSVVCERVRAQISLELDGELSELERRMVAVHVDRCTECRAFQADVVAFTYELRTAELEVLEQPVVVSRRRRASFARLQVGVAAAAAVVALGAISQVTGSESRSATLRTPARFATSTQLAREVQQIVADGRAFDHSQGSELAI